MDQHESELALEKPSNFAPSPSFKWLCEEFFVKIQLIQNDGRLRHGSKPISIRYLEVISHFTKLWRKTVGDDIYPALVLILPYRDRRTYNIKDYTLVKAICSYLRLPKGSTTEKRLLRWKQRAGRHTKLSDFCIDEIRKRKSEPIQTGAMTVDDVNEALDQLVEERSTRRRNYKGLASSPVFISCIESMSFMELKFFFDILLKNSLIGGHEHKLLDSWHPDAQDYLSVVSDLKTVAYKLWNPEIRLRHDDLSINVNYAFVPQLAKKLPSSASYKKMCQILDQKFLIEEKMDGERIQLHYMSYGSKLKFLSRRGTDYTYLYGGDLESGTIGKYIKLLENVKECILDGEMVSYDANRDTILPFGLVKNDARSALTTESIETADYHPLFMVFDIVYLNGTSLVSVPLHQRKEYLSKLLIPYEHFVQIIPFAQCSDENAIKKSLEAAISMGSEGIILKQYDSKYKVASRSNDWVKIKPEYLEQFGENMDLIVVGRDPGKKDSLMCGLAIIEEDKENSSDNDEIKVVELKSDEEEEEDADKTLESIDVFRKIKKFVSFCNVANGISQEEFREIDQKTRGLWVNSEARLPPPELLEFGTKIPLEWIPPQQSIVLEVKARSIDTGSTGKKYWTGCTLYGAYCRQIRSDKDWQTCSTLSEFYQTKNRKFRKSDTDHNNKDRNTRKNLKNRKYTLDKVLRKTRVSARTTNLFKGLYFYVLSDYISKEAKDRITKAELNELILDNGGVPLHNIISKHHNTSRLRLISSKNTIECKALIDRGYDIIHPQWLFDCVYSQRVVDLEPRHCFNVSQELMDLAASRVDKMSDSYARLITENELDDIFNEAQLRETPSTNLNNDFEKETIPLFLFWKFKVYFLDNGMSEYCLQTMKAQIQLYGGSVVDKLEHCNIIVASKEHTADREQALKELRNIMSRNVSSSNHPPSIKRIVNQAWIDQSIKEGCLVPEEDFAVK